MFANTFDDLCSQQNPAHASTIFQHAKEHRSPIRHTAITWYLHDTLMYVVYFNKRCLLRSRQLEQFASWMDEEVQLLG